MRIILHIGAHKTGTSYLQECLYNNYEHLLSRKILYPKSISSGFNHGVFANTFKCEDSSSSLDMIENLLSEIKMTRPETVIISSECFMEHCSIASRVKKRLDIFDVYIEVVYYFREPLKWLSSLFNEIVRDPYRRYTGEIEESREFEARYYIHQNLVKEWVREFGHDNVSGHSFDIERESGGLLSHFISIIDANGELDVGAMENESPLASNLALKPPYVRLLQKINQVPLAISDYRRIVSELNTISSIDDNYYGELIDRKIIAIERGADSDGDSLIYVSDSVLESRIFSKLSERSRKIINHNSMLIPNIVCDGEIVLSFKNKHDRMKKVIFRQHYELENFYNMRDTTNTIDGQLHRIIAQRNLVRDYESGKVSLVDFSERNYLMKLFKRIVRLLGVRS